MGLPDLAPEERRALQAARKREKHAARAALKEIDPRLAKVRERTMPDAVAPRSAVDGGT